MQELFDSSLSYTWEDPSDNKGGGITTYTAMFEVPFEEENLTVGDLPLGVIEDLVEDGDPSEWFFLLDPSAIHAG